MSVVSLGKRPQIQVPSGSARNERVGRGHWWEREHVVPYLLVAPAIAFELLVHIIPMVAGIAMSFFGLTIFTIHHWASAPFVGLANYRLALNFSAPVGRGLLDSLAVTVPYAVLVVAISWVIGMAAAVCLNVEFRGRSWLRSLFLVPYALPGYVGVIVWSFMLQRDSGVINHLLVNNLHLLHTAPFWLLRGKAFWSMVMAATWRTWPFAFLMLLAALQGIPDDYYEAATVDGASLWRQLRSITLPQIRWTNMILVLLLGVGLFNDFGTPFVMFGNTPPPSATLISIRIYGDAFSSWNFGVGSAMSVVLLVILAAVSFVYLRMLRVGGKPNA